MTNKNLEPADQPVERQDDLDRNPSIGQSTGLFSRESPDDADLIEGEISVGGDVENDAGVGEGAGPKVGRTND